MGDVERFRFGDGVYVYAGEFDSLVETAQQDRLALLTVEAERDQLRQQVEKLLGALDVHRQIGWQGWPVPPTSRDGALYQAADQVRKELEGR